MPMNPEMRFTGLPMDQFKDLVIRRKDGSEVKFNDVVQGFIQYHDESLEDAILKAAQTACGAANVSGIIVKTEN